MKKIKKIEDLSPKRRLNRLVKILEKEKESLGIIKVVSIERLAPHAAMLGIGTKERRIVVQFSKTRALEIVWLDKDSYNDLTDRLTVMLLNLRGEGAELTANCICAMYYNINNGVFYLKDKASGPGPEVEKEFYEKTDFLKRISNMSNAEKFIDRIV